MRDMQSSSSVVVFL